VLRAILVGLVARLRPLRHVAGVAALMYSHHSRK
jgi:hypothetical protein